MSREPLSLEDFRELVQKMRDAQRVYFETRRPAALRGAKDLERRVDTELLFYKVHHTAPPLPITWGPPKP
jgi:predicted alternative tryptophan synthase beta-subunit